MAPTRYTHDPFNRKLNHLLSLTFSLSGMDQHKAKLRRVRVLTMIQAMFDAGDIYAGVEMVCREQELFESNQFTKGLSMQCINHYKHIIKLPCVEIDSEKKEKD